MATLATLLMPPPAPAVATTPAAGPAVAGRGLGLDIDGRCILDGIDLELPRGICAALLGRNGAGKTSLLRVLGTLVRPTRGGLALLGGEVGRDASALRARIGLISHRTMLYRDLTALENLAFFGGLYRVAEPRRRGMEMLERLGIADRSGDRVRTLSRGTAQRVAIGRALIHGPDLLLADEPFTGLDDPARERVGRMFLDLTARGGTVIVAHHDIGHALRIADRTLVLRAGRLVLDSPGTLGPGDVVGAMGGPP